ncbi:MAG: metallophosphoesterase [Acidobacteriales bacterium]|nr:metallophosphoesterase [Terriglobales bacterium]
MPRLAAQKKAEENKPPKRELKDLKNLPRSALGSKVRAVVERAGHEPSRPILALFSARPWREWFKSYARHAFKRSYRPFPAYTSGANGIYPLLNRDGETRVRIGLAGDWGSGTEEAECVALAMEDANLDFTVHLGDVYYTGDTLSIKENCLGEDNVKTGFRPLNWPRGSVGSFALNGNHEMYAEGGRPYFECLLPEMGFTGAKGQKASFFCLENDFWRVIGLDTGYHSRGWPFIGMWWQHTRLPAELVAWLREIVRPQDDNKGLVLLSHHQYFSLFGDEIDYPRPAKQLAPFVKRPPLWFWGHEHRMAGYDLYGPRVLQVHGRCIGHAGMPVSRRVPPPHEKSKLLFYDNRHHPLHNKKDYRSFGRNGYATLEFDERDLVIKYFDVHTVAEPESQLLLQEQWKTEADATLTRVAITQHCFDQDFYGPERRGSPDAPSFSK